MAWLANPHPPKAVFVLEAQSLRISPACAQSLLPLKLSEAFFN